MTYDPEQIKKANRSCRDSGAIGTSPKLLEILKGLDPGQHLIVLDYGAGKEARQAAELRTLGFDVTAHEFGANFDHAHHDPKALDRKYSLIYASNVLNVQGDLAMLRRMLLEIHACMTWDSVFYCNYPRQPRYIPDLNDPGMQLELERGFSIVVKTPIPYNGTIFKCRK